MSRLATDEAVQPPPAAPPLPPPRYATRAANALARFAQPFFQGSRPASPDEETPRKPPTPGLRPLNARSNVSSFSSVVHRTGIPIAALDISPDKSHVVLAGREILKTVRVTPDSCNEAFNLRSAIASYSSTHSSSQERGGVWRKSQLTANDVKWSHSNYSSVIATAAPNGQIVLYDLEKASVQVACLHEHTRQVHRLAFNSHHAALLLSGSQDGTTRLWDLRAGHRSGAVGRFESRALFASNSESVRDVRWSPTKGVEFIACTESGMIQQWDILQSGKPILRFKAHAKACRAIDWHPDGKHVVSGGADKVVNTWDLSTHNFRMKPYLQIRAPQPITNVRWRPPCLSGRHRPEYWQTTQLAATYDAQEPKIQIWDFRRPYIPFREIAHFDTPAMDLLWHSEDLLWSVGNTGMFTQSDIEQTRSPFRNKSSNGLAVSPEGQMCFFSEGRRPNRSSSNNDYSDFLQQAMPITIEKTRNPSESPVGNEGSLEDANTNIPVRFRQRKPPKSLAFRSTNNSFSMGGSGQSLLSFDKSVPRHIPFQLMQATAYGGVADVSRFELFRFFAETYQLVDGTTDLDHDVDSHSSIARTFERNAEIATFMGEYQLGKSWRILAWAINKELLTRSQHDQDCASVREEPREPIKIPGSALKPVNAKGNGTDLAVALQSNEAAQSRSDYGSNAATPIVRPVSDLTILLEQNRARTREIDITKLALSTSKPSASDSLHPQKPSSQRPKLLLPQPVKSSYEENVLISTSHSSDSELATGTMDLEEYWNERRAAANTYHPKTRPVLRLDQQSKTIGQSAILPSFIRHNSDESDPIFSASTDNSLRTASLGSSFNSSIIAGSPLRNVLHAVANGEDLHSGASISQAGPQSEIEVSAQRLPPIVTGGPAHIKPEARHAIRPQKRQAPMVHTEEMEGLKALGLESKDGSPDAIAKSSPEQPRYQAHTLDAPPWSATAMLHPLLKYHTDRLSDCQLPAHIITSLVPLLSHDMPLAFLESILLTYHDQLTSMSLFVEAAHLRKVLRLSYPEVSAYGTFGVKAGGPWCTFCKKPSKGEENGFCERCKSRWDECVICGGDEIFSCQQLGNSFDPSEQIHDQEQSCPLWAWCQECGHSQHSSCLQKWWSDPEMSQGYCPVTGCLHACVPGKARDDMLKAGAEERKAGQYVRSDEWTIGESRAVQKARRLVSGGQASGSRVDS